MTVVTAIWAGAALTGVLAVAFAVWGFLSEKPLTYPHEFTGPRAYAGQRSGDLPEVLYDEVMDRARHSLDLRIK